MGFGRYHKFQYPEYQNLKMMGTEVPASVLLRDQRHRFVFVAQYKVLAAAGSCSVGQTGEEGELVDGRRYNEGSSPPFPFLFLLPNPLPFFSPPAWVNL